MPNPDLERLRGIKTFDSLVEYLRDDLDWPIETDKFDDLTFDFEPEELGIDPKTSAKIESIKQLRPLSSNQPWGIFFVKFEPKRLPVVALRRILGQLVIKKRASANRADQQTWKLSDLLFLSNYGENEQRQITFAHFSGNGDSKNLPTLKVLGWDDSDTPLHIDHVHTTLRDKLRWPGDDPDLDIWRESWSSAFTLRHREVIETSRELAVRLASLAQKIRKRANSILSIETDSGPLSMLMKGFKEALIHDLTEDSFSDMYAQTIAYGLLTARITNRKGDNPDELSSQMPITNPFLKELMESFLSVGGRKGKSGTGVGIDFDELGVNEVVGLLDNSNMEAVVRDFGDKNPLEDPVIHFYELFLHEYDSEVRMQRGVFYTPRPVVSFIVRSVDKILRAEYGLEDGLADTTTWSEIVKRNEELKIPKGLNPDDPFVQILDPATGTGTFLVEVIDLIHKTMVARWKDEGNSSKRIEQLWNDYVPKYLLTRLHGYELLMAPYAIAHMKIGLKLFETGYDFGSNERTHIYLTNALEPAQDFSDSFSFMIPALAHEAKAVSQIKTNQLFTIVIGNPPYAYESANNGEWICQLIKNYYFVDGSPLGERNPRGLQDDYVKFIRFAQATLSETGIGVLGFITNHGYLSNPTFRGMRQSLKDEFAKIYAIDLHGNSKRNECAPDGTKDENVFDIMQGVAIIFAALNFKQSDARQIFRSDLFGLRTIKNKILSKLNFSEFLWDLINPSSPFYLFRKIEDELRAEYMEGQSVTDIFSISSVGISTSRDDLCISFTAEEAYKTTDEFVSLSPETAREKFHLGADVQDWKVSLAQDDVGKNGLTMKYITPVFYRPFDVRWTYYTGKTRGFHSRPRGEVMSHMLGGNNLAICSSRQVNEEFRHAFVSRTISDGNSVSLESRERTYIFPLYLNIDDQPELGFSSETSVKRPNLTPQFLTRIAEKMNLSQVGEDLLPKELTTEGIFFYIYAILHSPNYRNRYLEFLKIDFPRLPLTPNLELFLALAKHGGDLVSLHLMESSKIKELITTTIGSGKFQVEKFSFSDEIVWLDNEKTSGFKGVPEEVWEFHIGGYQVCKKWLKDRQGRGGQNPRSGRILSKEDIDHYQKIIVAISETIRIMGEIDEVIEEHGGWPSAFVTE
ncbi:MAG: N-6 DNA methylase [Nitrospina sp.]|jgi:hypothetical protein|nr:N-6 DNA methylase [Nitrospina sp.]